MKGPSTDIAQQIQEAHRLYGQLTGQTLLLGYERERAWYELLRAGFTLEDVSRVIRYLQREIRHQRRNVGALKLRNLLQPDQFEEDLNISRVRLHPPPKPAPPSTPQKSNTPALNPEQLACRRQEVARRLAEFRAAL